MEKEAHLQAHMEQLYLEMSSHLVRYAYASVHNAETAKDLVQDVFKVACVKYEELAASANPRGMADEHDEIYSVELSSGKGPIDQCPLQADG